LKIRIGQLTRCRTPFLCMYSSPLSDMASQLLMSAFWNTSDLSRMTASRSVSRNSRTRLTFCFVEKTSSSYGNEHENNAGAGEAHGYDVGMM
jgi:hypothetical protein